MSEQKAEVIKRIKEKGIRHDDIRHPGRLTNEQIKTISELQAFNWVREHLWTYKHFSKWYKVKNEVNINE